MFGARVRCAAVQRRSADMGGPLKPRQVSHRGRGSRVMRSDRQRTRRRYVQADLVGTWCEHVVVADRFLYRYFPRRASGSLGSNDGGAVVGKRLTGVTAAVVVALAAFVSVVGPAGAASNFCIATDGVVRHQSGTATCSASGEGSVAIAKGDLSFARATGNYNQAKALGENSAALAENGERNTATASGDFSRAVAESGNDNTATASGEGSEAEARVGNGNRAIASGDNSIAEAEEGDGNTAIASGDFSFAVAVLGDGNRSVASGFNSDAVSGNGDNNTAIAASDNCRADTGVETGGSDGATVSC
jgi:hypothetical protein